MKLAEIHHTLVKIRKERNLSQRDIADALNVEQATVSMYETGRRGIPLDVLDSWLQLMEIEIKIIPKGFEPLKAPKDVADGLNKFNDLKTRRNYLVAELRALMAEKVLQVSEFQKVDNETGEGVFWPYSFPASEAVGLIETRYDHPEQKYLAVEYTRNEVNVYRLLPASETNNGKSDYELINANRIYFSEDDFLTASALWEYDDMQMRKMTILRRSNIHPDGVEIIDPEGFSIRALVEMMENYKRFSEVVNALERDWKHVSMEQELETIGAEMLNIVENNRLANGLYNPDFVFWSNEDLAVIDVPLSEIPRNWSWVEQGVEWTQGF